MDDKKIELIYEAYDIIGSLTPLRGDCGKLCDKICCKGDKAGMLLFPGEESIFEGIVGFSIEELEYMDTAGMKLLMCDGDCERGLRPLSCRIFPAAPLVGENGVVDAVADIRGRRVCPIWDLKYVDGAFVRAVKKAFELLAKNNEMLAFMRLVSAEQEELMRFYKL